MINLDSLENLRLERISPALSRKKWDLPFQYENEYLGGFYNGPVRSGADGPVGIGLQFGAKTGDKQPVSLELSCTQGVLLPGARYYTYKFHKPAASRANEVCRLMSLPALLGEPVVDPVAIWQSAVPGSKPRLFKTGNGFGLVVESDGTLVDVHISHLTPLKGARYLGMRLFDLQRVAKNCPRREGNEMFGYIRNPGELLRGSNLMDAAEFRLAPNGKSHLWSQRVNNPLREFQLQIRGGKAGKRLDEQALNAALELVLCAEESEEQIRNLVFGDYQRMVQLNPDRLAENKVPTSLRRKEVRDYITERRLVVEHGAKKDCTASVCVQPRWRGAEELVLEVRNGRIITVDGRSFKLREDVLWLEGDKPVKRRPRHEASPEQQAFANVLRMLPVQVSKSTPPRPLPSELRQLIAEVEAAGFIKLGWLEVMMMMPLKVVGFSNADGSICLSIAVNELFPMQTVDLVSHLDGTRTLTTSTSELVMPQPERGVFKFSHPKASIEGLLKKHLQHMRDLKGKPVPRQKTLQEFSRSIQECLRLEGQAQG
jgi:hypothetical protein